MREEEARSELLNQIQMVLSGHRIADALHALISATALTISTGVATREDGHAIADLLPSDVKARLDATWPEMEAAKADQLSGGEMGHG